MKTLVTILTLFVLAAMAGGGMYVINKAPPHSNLGNWSEILLPLGIAAGVMVVVVAAFGGGAWALWRAEYKMASQLRGVTAVIAGALVWFLGDALNVLLDDSSPTVHEVELIESVGATAKRSGYLVVTSWRVPGEKISLELRPAGTETPGMRLFVTTHEGAFGRPYAVKLEPVAAVNR